MRFSYATQTTPHPLICIIYSPSGRQFPPQPFSSSDVCLTAFLVQNDLCLELPTLVQSFLHLRGEAVAGLGAIQEVALAALLHQFATSKAGQLAKAVGAVDNGVEALDLGVSQDKVTVWGRGDKGTSKNLPEYKSEVLLLWAFPVWKKF